MTLEERIAAALHDFFEADGRAPDGTDREAARAVVAVLPKADVDDDPVGDTREQIYRATGRVYAQACARYEAAVQGNDWTERKAAHDQLQRTGEMHAKALAGLLEPMTTDEVAAFTRSLTRGWEALPTADVSDEDIWAIAQAETPEEVIARGRALLDAQAAAHAARLSGQQQHLERIVAERDGAVAEVEALRAEVERLTDCARAEREALVAEIRQHDAALTDRQRYRDALVKIGEWDCLNPPQADLLGDLPWLRSVVDDALLPGPDLGVWTQEQVDSINERAARRAEALAPLIEGDNDD